MSNETIGEQRERVLSDTILSVEAIKQIVKGMAEQAGLVVVGGTCKDCKWWTNEYHMIHETDEHKCLMLSTQQVVVSFAPYAQDAPEVFTPPDFACNQWESKA